VELCRPYRILHIGKTLALKGSEWLFSSCSHFTHRVGSWVSSGSEMAGIQNWFARLYCECYSVMPLPLRQLSYHIAFKYSGVRNLYKYLWTFCPKRKPWDISTFLITIVIMSCKISVLCHCLLETFALFGYYAAYVGICCWHFTTACWSHNVPTYAA
jgi:hypothetical protein